MKNILEDVLEIKLLSTYSSLMCGEIVSSRYMKRSHLIIIVLVLSIVSVSCMQEPQSVEFVVKTKSMERDVVAETRDILLRRYGEFLPSQFSKIDSTINGSSIHFVISNDAPSQEVIIYLTEPRGILEAFEFKKNVKRLWFTDQDLVSASVVPERKQNMLKLNITPEAGVRTSQLSRNNIGEKLTIEIDGRTVAEGVISELLSSSFLVHAPNSNYAHEMTAVLTFGRLPSTVKLEKWGSE